MAEGELNWLFLDMNAFFASVEQQLNPRLRGRPVGVVPVMADSSCCIAASYEAKRQGVKTGTRISDAKKLCPDIQLVTARPLEYVRVHDQIVEAVNSVIPVHKVHSIDEMACRLTGSQRQEARAIELGQRAKRAIREQVGEQLSSSVGIATNRFLAKVASNLRKPDGLSVIRSQDLPKILYTLALQDLTGIGKGMSARLQQYGIRSVEQLCALSNAQLREIWHGISGEWWWHALRGHDMPEPETKRRTVGHSHVLSPQYRTHEGARAVMVKLIHKAAVRLRKLGYYTAEISVSLRYSGKPDWQLKQAIEPCQDTQSLLKVFSGLWKQRPTQNAPMAVGVTLQKLVPESCMSLLLFSEDQRRHKLGVLMDEINARFGPQSVYLAAMHDTDEAAPMRISFTKIPDVEIEADRDR